METPGAAKVDSVDKATDKELEEYIDGARSGQRAAFRWLGRMARAEAILGLEDALDAVRQGYEEGDPTVLPDGGLPLEAAADLFDG